MNQKSQSKNSPEQNLFKAHNRAESERAMKKVIAISIVLALMFVSCGARASDITTEQKGVSLGIIIDTSPSSQKTWNMFQAAILEMAYQLKHGDKITVYTAHPGKPRLRIIRVIGPESKYNPSDIVRETTSFSRELLSGANLSSAIELVFSDFYREADQYQHCLAVLSNGKLNSYKITQIKRLVVNFDNNKWPTRFVFEQTKASRDALIAANNQKLNVRMLDKPQLTEWIKSLRKSIENETTMTPIDHDVTDHVEKVVEDVKPAGILYDQKPKEDDNKPIRVELTNLFPFKIDIPVASDPNNPTINKPSADETINEPVVSDTIDKAATDGTPNKTPIKEELIVEFDEADSVIDKKTINYWWLWFIVIAITLVCIILFVVNQTSRSSLGEQFGSQFNSQENQQQRLIGFIGEHQHDLGDIATLGELIIGRGMGSAIYLDNESVEERHIRIFKSGNKIRVQNLAASSISIDGAQLDRKKKADLIFPAEIELAGGVIITLCAEDINFIENESGDNNEEQSI